MVSWPAGHRWEDALVTIYDKTLAHKATLGTAHKLRYNKRPFGSYGVMLTFELDRSDPWVSELTNGQVHFIRVLEDKGDGTRWQTFSGFCIKEKDADEAGADTQFIEFTFLPLARMAEWRHGMPVTGETLEVTTKVDDGFKWIIERTLGATAPATPTTSVARAFTDFVVAANKSQYPSNVELKTTGQNIYEFLQLTGAAYKVDWDIYLNDTPAPEFETWYPRRGVDRTEDNGVNDECIITDKWGAFRRQEYQYDSTGVVSNVLDNRFTKDVGDADVATNWLYREVAIASSNEVTMAVELADRAPKRSWTMDEFVETEGCQWGLHFDVGDRVTVKSIEFGYTLEDTICDVTAEYDEKGFRHLTLTFGDPVPDNQDQQRGGGRRRLDPEYTDPRNIPDMALAILPVATSNVVGTGTRAAPDDHQHLLQVTADDAAYMPLTNGVGYLAGEDGISTRINGGKLYISGAGVGANVSFYGDDDPVVAGYFDPDDSYKFGIVGGTGISTTIAADPNNHYITINSAWQRTVGTPNWIGPATSTDKVSLNAAGAPAGANTWLYVNGDIEVESTIKAYTGRLYLSGQDGIIDCYTDGTATTFNVDDAAGDAQIGLLATGTSYFSGGNLIVQNSKNFETYADTGGANMTAQLAGASGNLWLITTATTHLGGYTYTWPTSGAATGESLTATVSGANITLAWTAPAPAAHDIVSAHTYTGGAALDVFGLSAANTIAKLTPSAAGAADAHLLCTDANGYLTVQRVYIYDANKSFERYGTVLRYNSDAYHTFRIGGANIVGIDASAVYPTTDSASTCGTDSLRWLDGYFDDLTVTAGGAITFGGDTNIYRSAANTLKTDDALTVTGTITGSSTSTAAIFQGNVTMASGKTVDGVDISEWKTAYDAHTHNYIKPVQYHATGYDGDVVTGEGVQTGSYAYYECDYSSDGGTRYYVYTATDSSGTSAAWRRIYFPSKPHYHNVSYDTVASAAP